MIRANDTSKWNLVFIIFASLLVIEQSPVKAELDSHANHLDIATSSFKKEFDKFGIKEIYPTKSGGREWYLNMGDPKDDRNFSVTFNHSLSRQADGSWRIAAPVVRMNVNTSAGQAHWKNVEITGYGKVVGIIPDQNNTVKDNDLSWYSRGGRHNSRVPCEATAYFGGLYADGGVGWKKEIWFVGGYTEERGNGQVTDPIIGRWVGLKVIMYNINNDSSVKLESYLDNKNTNYWVKVTDLVDDGGWYAKTSDSEFRLAGCNRDKDYIIINEGSVTTFRSDNLIWDFKDLSIREIDSHKP